jgi:hypothetical protein
MAARVTKEIVAVTGKYTDGQGREKNRYVKLGVVMEKDDGTEMIKLECIPLGWEGFAYLNTPRDSGGGQDRGGNASPQSRRPQQSRTQSSNSSFDDFDDDIPF